MLTFLHLFRKKRTSALKTTSSDFDLEPPPKKNTRGAGEKWEMVTQFNSVKEFESSDLGAEIKKHFSRHSTNPLKKTGGKTTLIINLI